MSLDITWWRGLDLNQRPSDYEPDELPDCSTPRRSTVAGQSHFPSEDSRLFQIFAAADETASDFHQFAAAQCGHRRNSDTFS